MMSNGPCSSRRSFQSGCRSIVAASTSSGDVEDEDVPEALALQAAQRRGAAARAGCGRRAGRSRGRAAPRLRSWQSSLRQVEDDRDRQDSGTRAPARPAAARASGWTLVASTTVSRPAREPLARRCSAGPRRRRRSPPGRSRRRRRGRGRSRTRGPRSAGSACARTCDLPEPDGADQHDEATARGSSICSSRRTPPSASAAPTLGVLGPDRQEAHARSRSAPATRLGPGRELGARPLEAVVAVAEAARPAASRSCTLYSAFGVVTTTVAGPRELEDARARSAARRGGSRCSITSTSGGRVEAREPPVAVGQRAVQQRDPRRAALGGRRSSCSRRAAISSARCETSTPTISLELPARRAARAAACPRRSRGRARAARRLPRSAATHRAEPLLVQADRRLDRLLLGVRRASRLVAGRRPRRDAAAPSASPRQARAGA